VVRSQLGEREAFGELVRVWHRPVWEYVRRMLGKPQLADDVSQEVWLAVVRGLPRLRDPERFAAWLFTVARRSVVNHLRDRYSEQPGPLTPEPGDPADAVIERLDLTRWLEEVPLVEREVLVLFHLEDLSLEECAQVLGVPVGTVKSRLFRARQLLRVAAEGGRA
jgi:RNA polymerase sigma-70 factor (ECF subfamily)